MTKTVDLFKTGIRPAIDKHLADEAAKVRDYGDYWSASSAGYCMRRQIFERLLTPYVAEDARKQRVFSAGHAFHAWIQAITDNTGLSIAQELELQDDDLMVRGHIDDLILLPTGLILYDYKTAHSKSFHWAKKENYPLSYYHEMQVGTYLYMLNHQNVFGTVDEARILKISKDDLTMMEYQVLHSPGLQLRVLDYWRELNEWWGGRKLPPCSCSDHDNGFMAKEAYNPYYYQGEPCSIAWFELNRKETV